MRFSTGKITNRNLDNLREYVLDNIDDNKLLIAMVYPNWESTTPSRAVFLNLDFQDVPKKVSDTMCPYCEKLLSSKTNRDRHVKNYCKLSGLVNDKNELILSNGVIKNIFPNLKLRDILYIAGQQGSGKSTYVKNYMQDYIRVFMPFETEKCLFEDSYSDESYDDYHRIILFSNLKHDDVLDNPLIIRPNMDDILEDPIDVVEDLKGSLCIFDDYTSLPKKEREEVERVITSAMEVGRDHHGNKDDDIYVCIVRHMLKDYRKTRDILFESSAITFFPQSGSQKQIIDTLKGYCGFSKQQIEKIINLPSRWVTVHIRFPFYVLYSGGVFIPK